jgi:hypothetical protein
MITFTFLFCCFMRTGVQSQDARRSPSTGRREFSVGPLRARRDDLNTSNPLVRPFS